MKAAALAVIASALSLAAAPASAAKPAHAAAPAHDWSRIVVATNEGGIRMGNPGAKVKLVEYGSLACPHCRHFQETGYGPLIQNYVRAGRVSYEYRNLMLNAPDIAVTLLTRCAGAANFFPMSAVVYSTQPVWEHRVDGMSSDDKAALAAMTDQQKLIRYAQVSGLLPVAARFGVTPVRAKQCLSDTKALQRLLAVDEAANDHGVNHTPTFFIDGKISDAAVWEQLEPQLKSALGG